MYSIVRRYSQVGLLALCVVLFSLTQCEAKKSGILQEQLKTAQSQAKQKDKAASIIKDSLVREKKRGDSLEKKSSVVRIKYVQLHDSLYKTDTVEIPQIVQLADSVIASQDSVIVSLKRQILLADHALSERESQISFLNAQIRIQAKQIRNVKVNGWLKTVGAFGGGVILGIASQ